MFRSRITLAATLFSGVLMATGTGCQTTIGGQTLPSGYYLEDDVQFFPAGPEFLLPKQVQALEQYRLQQDEFRKGAEGP